MLNNLIILEFANNHMGDVDHGLAMIRAFADVCREFPFRFAVKFQYRQLETFIAEKYKTDYSFKYIKRFQETALSDGQFATLRQAVRDNGFLTACTPFDEASVDRIVDEKFDILKIASCSLGDWPLIEKIGKIDLPIVFSTAGATAEDVKRMFIFFRHRRKNFAMLHCIGEYPADPKKAAMNQLDEFRRTFPDAVLGYSGHEDPDDTICASVAVAKGATVFERHVALPSGKYAVNAYSSTPQQLRTWLEAILRARAVCGDFQGYRTIGEKEKADLHGLRRACYLKRNKQKGETLERDDLQLALPNLDDHLTACELSKYSRIELTQDLSAGEPVLRSTVSITNHREMIFERVKRVVAMLREHRIVLPHLLDFEFSYHYGLERFDEFGATILNCVNREYCKKIVIVFPGQRHPMHFHRKKEETFQVLSGEFLLDRGDGERKYLPGDIIVIEREQKHAFRSETGAIFEEISTKHYKDDSFYDDVTIMNALRRKTTMSFWANDYEQEFSVSSPLPLGEG